MNNSDDSGLDALLTSSCPKFWILGNGLTKERPTAIPIPKDSTSQLWPILKNKHTHTWLYVQMYKRNHVNGNHIRKRFLTRRALIHRFPFSNLKTLTGFSHFEGIPKPSQHLLYCKTRMLLGLLVGTCKSWNPAVFQDASVKRAFWISTSVVSQMSQRSSKVVDFGQMYRPTRFPGMIRWYSSFARIW